MIEKHTGDNGFDFNTGYLVKSPCRGCATRDAFPGCMEGCEILQRIQICLSGSLSSANNYSAAETFDVSTFTWGQK